MKLKTISILSTLFLFGCATPLTPTQQAILTTSGNLARIAVDAAATYYGGPAAGQLAQAGLDSLGSVLQAYVGGTIPAEIVKASPGIKGVGTALVPLVAPNHVVSQADVKKVNEAAAIAVLIAPAVVTPSAP